MRYLHTNLIARDWRRLADFYCRVFGCRVLPPERHLSGDALDAGTGLARAQLDGVHLQLPGVPTGVTLEIFQYASLAPTTTPAPNRPGFGHVAFAVESVAEVRDQVVREGGGVVGSVVRTPITGRADVEWCYVTDPEGNVIELQTAGERV